MKEKVAYIVADLEGSTGAWTRSHTLLGTPEWQEARVELTRDMNAVVEALWEMGAGGVVVKDFHRTGYNLIPEYLDRRVKLVSGYYAGPAVGYGNLHGADVALFVGLHAAGGSSDGFLSHTLTSRIAEILVNGERICEAELFATVLAAFKVPVCFFSGCPVACREAARKMEWLATYEMAKDPAIYGDRNQREEYIRRQRRGLKARIKEISNPREKPLFTMKPPFDCRVLFRTEDEARRMNRWQFPQEGNALLFRTGRFLDLYQNLLKIAYFPRLAFHLRFLVLPLTRMAWKIQSLKHL